MIKGPYDNPPEPEPGNEGDAPDNWVDDAKLRAEFNVDLGQLIAKHVGRGLSIYSILDEMLELTMTSPKDVRQDNNR